MVYILLSLIILVAQGFLGMADWWVLGCNWIVAGLICLSLTAVLNNQRLVAFNNLSVSIKAWVLLSSIMNLSAIYVAPELTLAQVELMAAGYSALFAVGSFCWQNHQMPVRALLMGAILGLLTLCYMPSLILVIIPLLVFFHCLSWSKDNLACLFTGFVSMVWVIYCILSLGGGDANGYILSFATVWSSVTYSLPTLLTEAYTRWFFIASMLLLAVFYIMVGLLSSNLNSLRMRSNVNLHVMVGMLMLVLLPSCWQLLLTLIGITIGIQLMLDLGNDPSHLTRKFAPVAICLFLFMGIGEYLIRLLIDYVSTITFSLPFDLPFLN